MMRIRLVLPVRRASICRRCFAAPGSCHSRSALTFLLMLSNASCGSILFRPFAWKGLHCKPQPKELVHFVLLFESIKVIFNVFVFSL
jgi:hypothetical protein